MNKIKILYLVAAVLILQACNKPEKQPIPPRPALVIVVGETAKEKSMALVGEVKSRYESNQSFRIDGKIIERKVEVGDIVKKGQLLARLDATDTRLSSQAAMADVLSAQANYDLAKAEVERQRILVEKKFISQSALDLQEAQLKTSAAKLQQAKAQAAVTGNQTKYTKLVADRNGVVTKIIAEPGQVVSAGEMIAQIVDTKQIEVLAAVPESRMAGLKLNDAVHITLWADHEKVYEGKIREIAPAASTETRAFDIRVAVINADEHIKLGMTVGLKFANGAEENIIIPSAAITQINSKNLVWVIDSNGIANMREVTIGQFTEDGVRILNGLNKNEMVAIAGVHTLIKGQKVKPSIQKTELSL